MTINNLKDNYLDHWQKALAVRMLSIDAVQQANSGHPGMPMGMADVATVLFQNHLKFDSSNPEWHDRDRFILSAGHGSMLLYSILYLTGYPGITIDDITKFRQTHSITAGHPEYRYIRGIETTTGPLGQGLANAVGFALAERLLNAQWGKNIVNHRTYALVGDGCLMEGLSQEAITFAGKQQLDKLIVLWDDNGITIDGEVSKSCITNQPQRFESSGWDAFKCDGHNPDSIDRAITKAKKSPRPSLIQCKTHIGFGSQTKQDKASAHGSPLGEEEISKIREIYGWEYPPFEIPKNLKIKWEKIGARSRTLREDWEKHFSKLSSSKKQRFERVFNGQVPSNFSKKLNALKKEMALVQPNIASRKSSELTLKLINKILPETIGGSADLTGSNNTLTEGLGTSDPSNPNGRYIYYGIREHGMAAIMNGIALHCGLIPYGGTFMVFSDYARGGMRLSALMGLRVIYVMTHDSIGLGEDGPTHQPVEHLAMLRATPNTFMFRPADTIETIEAWETAITTVGTPSVLALSRQNLPTVRLKHTTKNLVSKGAYILNESKNKRRVLLLASGSEVTIALSAQEKLESMGIGVRVVSMPCWELFEKQDALYRKRVLPSGPIRIAIEAGVQQGWEKWLFGERGNPRKAAFIGMNRFGASGPAEELYKDFKITPQAILEKVEELLSN
ncbi:MAG: transketolase [Paracoccaceae bacterium]|nr:transketolase [Paracoccaceae bacterium]